MKSWENVEADKVQILNKHFTKGRNGQNIQFLVLHHNGGDLTVEGCYNVWQTREASANYQVETSGTIGQLVWDSDTAWHAGNYDANCKSIGIEHADDSTSPWHISAACLDNGAHLVAALCKYYKLGRPTWMVNVFPHNHFSATECPASIAGNQNAEYMARAQAYYDSMTGSKPAPAPMTPVKQNNYSNVVSSGSIQAGTYTVAVDELHVRAAASTSSEIVASYRNGQTVNLDGWMGIADGYRWVRYIGSSGNTRYIALGPADGSSNYLSRGSAPQAIGLAAGSYRVEVPVLNVRDNPSMSAAVVAQYNSGQVINLDGWSNYIDGYLWGRYLGYSGNLRYIAVGPADGSTNYLVKL